MGYRDKVVGGRSKVGVDVIVIFFAVSVLESMNRNARKLAAAVYDGGV